MKIRKILAVAMVCLALMSAFSASASALEGEELLAKVNFEKLEEIKEEKEERAAAAAEFFVIDRQSGPAEMALVKAEISDKALENLKLSAPIPVLASGEKYFPGESYLSKLKSTGYIQIGYIDALPTCGVGMNAGGIATHWFGETKAVALHDAKEKLLAAGAVEEEIVVLPAGGIYFLADMNSGAVAMAMPKTLPYYVDYPFTNLDAFALAFEESVIYYAERFAEVGVVEDGGAKMLELLFAGNTPAAVTASEQSPATPWLTVAICAGGAALLGAAALEILKKRGGGATAR
jgi:hypothetical protein